VRATASKRLSFIVMEIFPHVQVSGDEIFFLSELISTSGANDMFMHEISENLYGVK